MRKSIKKICVLLAALTCSSVLASAASAKSIFVAVPNKTNNDKEIVKTEPEIEIKPELKPDSDKGNIITTPIYKAEDYYCGRYPAVKHDCIKYGCCNIISGGKYFGIADAKAELLYYFKRNSSDFSMVKGESRYFCDGAYFYSDNTAVVAYNEETGTIDAKEVGTASVYVYTKGGIPFYRLDITVGEKTAEKLPETLRIIPADKELKAGECTALTVTTSDGSVISNAALSIKAGAYAAYISYNGKLVAEKNGVVVIHAESLSDPSVYGDCVVYIGGYRNAISSGYWTDCDGGIHVDKWFNGYFGNSFCKPSGWIKCTDGFMIPVLKLEDAGIVEPDGTIKDSTILTTGGISIFDYILGAYDKDDIIAVINKYNLFKPGFYFNPYYFKPGCYVKPGYNVTAGSYIKFLFNAADINSADVVHPYNKVVWDWKNDFDFKNFALSVMLKDILG